MEHNDYGGVITNAVLGRNHSIFGTLLVDAKGRFPPNSEIVTSTVQRVDGDMIYTLNTTYKIQGGFTIA